ncbi:MAG: TPM domain-containing protein [Spirochaetes bacterium]|nr:TPM domain-containing protein [Spirochaetota bacterium]
MEGRHTGHPLAPLLIALLICAPLTAAIPVPRLEGRVTDRAGILSKATREHVGTLLKAHEDRTTNQVAVLTVPTLDGESIEEFATRVFDAWRLGQKGKDNGVLVIIASGDRRMRIEVGYGLEGALTDLKSGRIIDNIMAPRFKVNDYDGGVTGGVLAIITLLEDPAAAIPDGSESSSEESGSFFEGPDLGIVERILIGCFIFGIIGLFTIIGVLTPGMGWFLYVFLIPFWAMFPIIVVGARGAITLLVTYLVAFPVVKLAIRRSEWYKKARNDLKNKGSATIGGFTVTSGGSSSSGGWSSSGSSGGFSGGGGSSGGGGASGGW